MSNIVKKTVFDFNVTGDLVVTGKVAIGSNATLGTYNGYDTLYNVQETITDWSNVNKYASVSEIKISPSAPLTDITFAAYERLLTIPSSNTHNITAFNLSALEFFFNNDGSGDVSLGFGIFGGAYHNGSGDITDVLAAGYFFSAITGTGSVIGDIDKFGNFGVAVGTGNYGTGIIFRNYAYYAEQPYGTGEIKKNWGLYIEDQQIGTVDSFAIETAGGKWKAAMESPILAGSEDYSCFDLQITSANHTGSGNTLQGINISGITFDAQCVATAIKIGSGWSYGISMPTNVGIAFGNSQEAQLLYDGSALASTLNLTVTGKVSISSNLLVGQLSEGTDGDQILVLANTATEPLDSLDVAQLYAKDITAGRATLATFVEESVNVDAALVSTHSIIEWINGVKYKRMLVAV